MYLRPAGEAATQTINALRAHLAEQGIVEPAGPAHVHRLAAVVDGDDGTLPAAVRELARLLLDQIEDLSEKISGLDSELRRRAATDDTARQLFTGAIAMVRWAARKGAPEGSWLERMLARKPKMVVAVALANRMVRTAWALMRKGEDYRDPVSPR